MLLNFPDGHLYTFISLSRSLSLFLSVSVSSQLPPFVCCLSTRYVCVCVCDREKSGGLGDIWEQFYYTKNLCRHTGRRRDSDILHALCIHTQPPPPPFHHGILSIRKLMGCKTIYSCQGEWEREIVIRATHYSHHHRVDTSEGIVLHTAPKNTTYLWLTICCFTSQMPG